MKFTSPAAGFDEPFAMLHACHERALRSLSLLERLMAHVAKHGADAQARDATRDVMRYFDIAAPQHHEDEERHVLPLLRAQAEGALADRLVADHEAMTAAWCALRPALLATEQGGDTPAMQDAPRFIALCREHIALEESAAFARAQSALDASQQSAMGREMAQRRGVAI
jgi:hemerythrin-like domain-containing protein